jgi:SIR2-like domain
VLLLGAGASLRSGIPLAGGVVEKAARWAYARDNGRSDDDPRLQRSDWLPWLRKLTWYDDAKSFAENYPYVVEHLLQPRQARAEFFRKLLNPGVDPSPGYEKLAEFLHVGPVKNILTTNFDTILPQVRVLKRRPHVIDVIQTAADYTKFSTTPLHPQLVYLHGSVDHYTDRNLIDEVQRLDGAMVTMLVPLLRDHPLVVVGYRGAEPSVMKHLLIENAESTNHFRHGIFCSPTASAGRTC